MAIDDGTSAGSARNVTFRTVDQLKNWKIDEETIIKKNIDKLKELGVDVVSNINLML